MKRDEKLNTGKSKNDSHYPIAAIALDRSRISS